MSEKLKKLSYRFLLNPILDQIKQGADARSLSSAVAAGATIAILPVLGATTALCAFVGIRWKLNQPILQLVNYFLYPVQILLIPVFIYWGAMLLGVEPVSFNLQTVLMEFKADPGLFFSNYGMAGLRAVLAWALLSPVVFFTVRTLSFLIFKRMIRNEGAGSP